MNIAIIGSGFFGIACSLYLSKKHNIDLYEDQSDILQQASKKNQFRFHLGYHYPRSDKTVQEIKKSNSLFTNFYKGMFLIKTKNYYAIAKQNSKTTLKKFLYFAKKHNLFLKKDVNTGNPYRSNFYLSNETNLNYFSFKKLIKMKIKGNKSIQLFLKTKFTKKLLPKYDKVIVCCYNNNNKVLNSIGVKKITKLKYELVEKLVIKLPKEYRNKSYIILDGKFVCVDPYLGTKYHLLSDVKHSKLEVVKSLFPNFINKKKKYLNKGLVKVKNNINFFNFINNSKKYLPFLSDAKYIGSFFVVRTLSLSKNSINKDERVNYIKQYGNVYSILAGKWNTSVWIAKTIEQLLKK